MTENKSYELTINERGQLDIIDHIEGKKRNAICIYNDLGVPPYSSAKAVCDLLNEKEELIKRLKTIREEQTETILKQKRKIKELEERNQRQYNRLKELTELMCERQWGKLENIVEEWEKADELLEQEWNNCEDL